MKRTKNRGTLLAGLAVVLLAACSSSTKTSTPSASAGSAPAAASSGGGCASTASSIDYSKLTGTLNGSGSSFQDIFNQKMISDFKAKASGVSVTYTKSGSGAGKQDLQNGVVQFAGTDSLIKASDMAKFKGEILYFPTVVAPITVSYNVSGVTQLKLSGETVAGIFSGAIKAWNDPKVAADNPGVNLPSTPITVFHRSEGSGTTNNFTKFLAAVGGPNWALGSGDTVNWPDGPNVQGKQNNSGVATAVKATDGGIGYVDLADAVNAGLRTASIKNKDGNFVEPKLPGASAAVKGANVASDLTFDPIYGGGTDAYPITAPTWIITYAKQPNQATADALKGFLSFVLTEGQNAANSVGYAGLPCNVQAQAVAQLSKITV